MASKMSTFSRFSVNAASGVVPTPPVPESRPGIDSSGSSQLEEDGHRPLRETAKAPDGDEGPPDVDGFGGICIYPEQRLVRRANIPR